jgi:hypothetical protein
MVELKKETKGVIAKNNQNSLELFIADNRQK